MRDHDYSDAVDFLARFFEGTEHVVEIRALPQDGPGRVWPLFTRETDLVVAHCRRLDDLGRAVYFGTATREGGLARGDRAHCRELTSVWTDIDCYKAGIAKEEAVAALLALPVPASIVIDSGGGIHGYWLLREAFDISQSVPGWPEVELRVVSVLRQLAGVLAGDLSVCDLARIMRLPGTHNTKDGTLRLCTVLGCSSWARVALDDLEDMLAVQRPLLRAAFIATPQVVDNPFLIAARDLSFKPPLDVEARLAAMTYLGSGDSAVHATQLSVTASLVASGVDDLVIIPLVLAATEHAAGTLAAAWNWRREEAALRRMTESARAKFAPENRPSSRSSATIIELRSGGAKTKPDDDPEATPAAAAKDLPEIRLGGGWLAANIDEAETHLAATRPRLPLFIYGDMLARVAPGPIVVAIGHRPQEILAYRVIEMRTTSLRDDLSRHVDFRKYDGRKKKWLSVNCPTDIAEGLLARIGRWRKLPTLRGIIAAPVIRPDNTLLDQPGYDDATGLYFAPGSTVFPPLPPSPTQDDARAAIATLKYPLRDIPFVDAASWSVALSAILTGLDRVTMQFSPIHCFDAPQAGSGKGLVCNYSSVIATGHEAGAILASDDPQETDKTLGAKIIAGHSVILLDNVDHVLKSALLAQIASEPYVEPRILGRSAIVKIQNTFSILVNGNNLILGGDLPRRSLKARLDARVTRPELRTFSSDNPIIAAKRDRGRLVAAGLTALLAYRIAGMPDQGVSPLGTFDEWSSHVRSALIWAGEADPVATQETIRAADKQLENHANLMAAWRDVIQVGVSASRLAEIACQMTSSTDDASGGAFGAPTRKNPELFDALCEIAPSRSLDKIDTARLGYYLRAHVDHTVADMRIERVGADRNKIALWRVTNFDYSDASTGV